MKDVYGDDYFNTLMTQINLLPHSKCWMFWRIPGITFPLNLTQPSAHNCPSKYDPYIFLHCAQFRRQRFNISKSPAESSKFQKEIENRKNNEFRRLGNNFWTVITLKITITFLTNYRVSITHSNQHQHNKWNKSDWSHFGKHFFSAEYFFSDKRSKKKLKRKK